MDVEHHKANLGNLGEEFLDKDPQQGGDSSSYLTQNPELDDDLEERDADDIPPLDFAAAYSDDVTLGTDMDKTGPLDTEFLIPAPGQFLNADDEPGGMYGSTADELLGSPGPDEQDLGTVEGDTSHIMRTFGDASANLQSGGESDTIVELQGGRNVRTDTGPEDLLSTDLPIGGTDDVTGELIDPDTGEFSDYDDDKQA